MQYEVADGERLGYQWALVCTAGSGPVLYTSPSNPPWPWGANSVLWRTHKALLMSIPKPHSLWVHSPLTCQTTIFYMLPAFLTLEARVLGSLRPPPAGIRILPNTYGPWTITRFESGGCCEFESYSLCWLVLVNLIQTRYLWRGTYTEEFPLLNWSVGKSVRHFLDCLLM